MASGSGYSYAQFNPCCCISLKSGATIITIFDIFYGSVNILRFAYIEHLRNTQEDFFPDDIPHPTQSNFMHFMFRRGNFAAMIFTGISLFIAIQYLRKKFVVLTGICYIWMIIRGFLIISLIIFCNALLNSTVKHLKRYGYEIMFSVFLSVYFLVVVACFLKETRIELNATRAIKPINIIEGEHEGYLLRDKNSMFDNATSFQTLSPTYFLNSKYIQETELATDPSQLQYSLPKAKVDVVSEKKALREMELEKRKKKRAEQLTISSPTTALSFKTASDTSKMMTEDQSNTSEDFENTASRKKRRTTLTIVPTVTQSRRNSPRKSSMVETQNRAPRVSLGFRQLIVNKEANEKGEFEPEHEPEPATKPAANARRLTFHFDNPN